MKHILFYIFSFHLFCNSIYGNEVQQLIQLAEKGNAKAQYIIGVHYYKGEVLKKDLQKSIHWIKKSSQQNYADAQFFLSFCYSNGIGVKQDAQQFKIWLKKAADNGHKEAKKRLSLLIDNVSIKAQSGDANSQYLLGLHFYKRNDFKNAILWFEKAAYQNNPKAQWNLGQCYFLGQGVKTDKTKSFGWYTKSAKQNYVNAQRDLALSFLEGYGTKKDLEKAIQWFTKASDNNDVNSSTYLGLLLAKKDKKKAVEYHKRAIARGGKLSEYPLGLIYSEVQEFDDALFYFRKASTHNVEAQFQLAKYYELGLGVDKDLEIAVDWYKKAAAKGHIRSQQKLGISKFKKQHFENLKQLETQKKYKDMIQIYITLSSLDPANKEEYYFKLINIKIDQLKLYGEVKQELKNIIEKKPKYKAKSLFYLAKINVIESKNKLALQQLDESIKLETKYAEAYELRAKIYQSQGKTELAELDTFAAEAIRKLASNKKE